MTSIIDNVKIIPIGENTTEMIGIWDDINKIFTETRNLENLMNAEQNLNNITILTNTHRATHFYQVSKLLSLLQEKGLLLHYNSIISYALNAFVLDNATSNIYKSLIDNNLNHALLDNTKWELQGNLNHLQTIQNALLKDGTIPMTGNLNLNNNNITNINQISSCTITRQNTINEGGQLEYQDASTNGWMYTDVVGASGANRRFRIVSIINNVVLTLMELAVNNSGNFVNAYINAQEILRIHSSSTNYLRLSNGLLMQWGSIATGNREAVYNVSFPITYLQVINLIPTLVDGENECISSVGSLTISGFSIKIKGLSGATPDSGNLHWFAIGFVNAV